MIKASLFYRCVEGKSKGVKKTTVLIHPEVLLVYHLLLTGPVVVAAPSHGPGAALGKHRALVQPEGLPVDTSAHGEPSSNFAPHSWLIWSTWR